MRDVLSETDRERLDADLLALAAAEKPSHGAAAGGGGGESIQLDAVRRSDRRHAAAR